MSTSLLECPFGIDLMVPAGEVVNGPAEMATKTGYTTTYEFNPSAAKSQKKDDESDSDE
jgi:hypothetical protein